MGPRCKQGSYHPYSCTPTPAASTILSFLFSSLYSQLYHFFLNQYSLPTMLNINIVGENKYATLYSTLLYFK
jgi:hypothetical protein